MAEQQAPQGSIRVTGGAEVEFVDIEIQLDDESRVQFEKDPHATLRAFLEAQGQVVNAVVLPSGMLRRPMGRFVHIKPPSSEASQWIYIGDRE